LEILVIRMEIRLALKSDIEDISRLHHEGITSGFLSSLGMKFLSKFYSFMLNSKNAFLVVAENKGKIVGFISGCSDINYFYREFKRNNLISIFLILFPKFFNPVFLRKIFETMKYASREDESSPKAELVSIVVGEEFRRRGVGRKLLRKFLKKMGKRKIDIVKVVVGADLKEAINFYEKEGFKFYSTINLHNDMNSKIYIYNLK